MNMDGTMDNNEYIKWHNRGKLMKLKCICKGNWRTIIHNSEPLFGKKYMDKDGNKFVFYGVMHDEDDYYYVLWNQEKSIFLSCVGSIEMYGFVLEEGL